MLWVVVLVVIVGGGGFVRYLICAGISVVTYIIQWHLASFEVARITTLFTFSNSRAVQKL